MLLKTLVLIVAIVLSTFPVTSFARADTVAGDWNGVFSIAGQTASVTLRFEVNGSVVTGTVVSEHTGPGTITEGRWDGNKLSCTFIFQKHESIAVTGELKEGTLVGSFVTEGMTGSWTASRKN